MGYLNKCLPGFKLLVEYDVNNIGQVEDDLDDKIDLSYGGMVFVSELGVMIVIDLKYPKYRSGSFLEKKRSITQMRYYKRYECLSEQIISQRRVKKLKKMVKEKFEKKCMVVIGAEFIYESSYLEFHDEFDNIIAQKVKELTKVDFDFDRFNADDITNNRSITKKVNKSEGIIFNGLI